MGEKAVRHAVHYALAAGVWSSAGLISIGLLLGSDVWIMGGLLVLLCTPALRVAILAGSYLRRGEWRFFLVSAGVLLMMLFGMRLGGR